MPNTINNALIIISVMDNLIEVRNLSKIYKSPSSFSNKNKFEDCGI